MAWVEKVQVAVAAGIGENQEGSAWIHKLRGPISAGLRSRSRRLMSFGE